jgi:Spy/CpxP family protein refolding chaperone
MIGTLFLTSLLAAQPPMAQRRDRSFARRPMQPPLQFLKSQRERLNITDEQLTRIEELTLRLEEKTVATRNALNTEQFELRKLMIDPEARDYDKIKAQLGRISQLRNEMLIERMRLQDEIRSVLTPEQREALKDMDIGRVRPGWERFRDRYPRSRQLPPRFRRDPDRIR